VHEPLASPTMDVRAGEAPSLDRDLELEHGLRRVTRRQADDLLPALHADVDVAVAVGAVGRGTAGATREVMADDPDGCRHLPIVSHRARGDTVTSRATH